MKRVLHFIFPVFTGMITLLSCVKKDFDNPPDRSLYDPELHVTHTIAQLQALNDPYNYNGGDTTLITDDVTIAGVVTADDRSGNFFKRIVLDDGTTGITLLIDAYSLYNDYPVGRKVYVKCKGLYLGYDGGLPVLGARPSEQLALLGIQGADINAHIIKGNIGNPVTSDTVELSDVLMNDPVFYNRLLTIRNIQFSDPDTPYTQPAATTNRYVEECGGGTLIVRTSNYAKFSGAKVPSGSGWITGVLTVYASSATNIKAQLVIRDTTDVVCPNMRCDW